MKVLLAGYLLGQGGIQSHLKWLSRMLGEEGIETLAISLGSRESTPEDWQDLQKFQSHKVRFVCCSLHKGVGLSSISSGCQRLTEITEIIKMFSPDVYLAVGTGWNLCLPPLLARTKTRLIFHEVMSGVLGTWTDSRWGVRWWFNEKIGLKYL